MNNVVKQLVKHPQSSERTTAASALLLRSEPIPKVYVYRMYAWIGKRCSPCLFSALVLDNVEWEAVISLYMES